MGDLFSSLSYKERDMMVEVRPFWSQIILALCFLIFLITRLTNLTILPIFIDEGIHLSWAIEIAETQQLIGVTDTGKYLPIWLYALFTPNVSNPLWSSRLFSVIAGFLTLLGLLWLGRLIERPQVGLAAAFLYVITPFTLFHDRMALVDGFLTTLLVYSLCFAIYWWKTGNWLAGISLAIILGSGGITKLYGIFLFIIPVVVIVLDYKPNRPWLKQLIWIYGLASLMLWPVFLEQQGLLDDIDSKLSGNNVNGNGNLIFENIQLSSSWLISYLTPIGFGIACLASLSLLFIKQRPSLILLGIIGLWWGIFVVISDAWYPRYLLPITPLLLFLIALQTYGLAQLLKNQFNWQRSNLLQFGVVCLITLVSFNFNRLLITNPTQAMFPTADREQYIESEWAGYRLTDVADYFHQVAAKQGSVIVVRSHRMTSLRPSLDVILQDKNPSIKVIDVNLNSDLSELAAHLALQSDPVFYVIDRPAQAAPLTNIQGLVTLTPAATFSKPNDIRQIEIYQVTLAAHSN